MLSASTYMYRYDFIPLNANSNGYNRSKKKGKKASRCDTCLQEGKTIETIVSIRRH